MTTPKAGTLPTPAQPCRPLRRRLCALAGIGALGLWLPLAPKASAQDLSQHDKFKEDLARALARDPDLTARNWEETAVVFDFEQDGRWIGTAGYACAPDRTNWRAISPSSPAVQKAVKAYWNWSNRVDGGSGMIGLLFQFNRESGKIRTDFEYEDPQRWAYDVEEAEMLIERMRPRLWN